MLQVHQDAVADLRGIRAKNALAAAKLVALLEQLRCDEGLRDRLLDHGYGDDRRTVISVSKWQSVQTKVERLPVWRLKSWQLERQRLKYRVIYLYNWQDRRFIILAIVPREGIDYDDPNHPIRKRVVHRIRTEFPNA